MISDLVSVGTSFKGQNKRNFSDIMQRNEYNVHLFRIKRNRS